MGVMVISKHPFIAVLLLATTTANAADNPMWRSGLQWTCTFSSAIRCERSTDCKSHPDEGTIKLNYQENSLVDHAGRSHAIKRHYVQTVAGSPIGSEVKIELTTNEVIWLSAADGGRDILRQLDWRHGFARRRGDCARIAAIDLHSRKLIGLTTIGSGIRPETLPRLRRDQNCFRTWKENLDRFLAISRRVPTFCQPPSKYLQTSTPRNKVAGWFRSRRIHTRMLSTNCNASGAKRR